MRKILIGVFKIHSHHFFIQMGISREPGDRFRSFFLHNVSLNEAYNVY